MHLTLKLMTPFLALKKTHLLIRENLTFIYIWTRKKG